MFWSHLHPLERRPRCCSTTRSRTKAAYPPPRPWPHHCLCPWLLHRVRAPAPHLLHVPLHEGIVLALCRPLLLVLRQVVLRLLLLLV